MLLYFSRDWFRFVFFIFEQNACAERHTAMEQPGSSSAEPHELNERVFRNTTNFRLFLAVCIALLCTLVFSYICFLVPGTAINTWIPVVFVFPFLGTRYLIYKITLKKTAREQKRTVPEIEAIAIRYGENEPDYRKIKPWIFPGFILLVTIILFAVTAWREHKLRTRSALAIGEVTGFSYRRGVAHASISYVVGLKHYEIKTSVDRRNGEYVFEYTAMPINKGDRVYVLYVSGEPEIAELIPERKVIDH